jgi:hypothetical protein
MTQHSEEENRMKRLLLTFAASAAALLAAPGITPRAAATSLASMSLADLAHAAGAIVRVRCVAASSRWDHGMIWTFTDFDVLERFKGAPADRIRVRVPGGRAGHLLTTIEETPRFQTGQESILFLENSPAGDYSITAWAEGTFRILQNAGNASEAVTQDSNGFPVFDPVTRHFHVEGIHNLPLDEFRRRLAAALAQQAPGRQAPAPHAQAGPR